MQSSRKTIQCKIKEVSTTPFVDQNPGTSGLRKKVKIFQQKNYLENFVQSIFNAHAKEDYVDKTLILGGDGRYYNKEAIDIIIKISFSNGIKKILVPENGIMSTPSVSVVIRNTENCFGGVILSASHNPGGIHEDFGIKFNSKNGAPSSESITNNIYSSTKNISSYLSLDFDEFDLFGKEADFVINGNSGYELRFVHSTEQYIELMKTQFDFDLIHSLFSKKGFSFVFDAMHGASGPYAVDIFHNIFKVSMNNLYNCNVLPDFGGHHPDPNLVHAKQLVEKMNIYENSSEESHNIIQFGAACDGDADRNMILGWKAFVSPSDSLAIIAANANSIKCFKNNLVGVARSMPTSRAIDRVCKKNNLPLYEVPTGWKFFGNLMDSNKINLCGEESFGTSSDHIREKDGIWAVLAWLSILADLNKDSDTFKVTVNDVLTNHWKQYGRDYYCRYDYEDLTLDDTNKVIDKIVHSFEDFNKKEGNKAFIFEYLDLVDNSLSKNQGWVFDFDSKARIIFRKSGTSSSGVTVRIYFEKYLNNDINLPLNVALKDLVAIALEISSIEKITGKLKPDVIT